MSDDHLSAFGRADALMAQMGFTTEVALGIAAIISFAGGIEYHLERALWRIRGIDPKGMKPDTDTRMSGELIAMLEKVASNRAIDAERRFLLDWCEAARSAFTIRHNIAHGVPMRFGETLTFMRNPRWEGEQRRRAFGDFWADPHTLDLVKQAMATLLRIIETLGRNGSDLPSTTTPASARALQAARSVLGEFASQDYNPSFEKY